ncbi:MAG TPA: hypothetical protein VED45_04540 [Steroidobacteraceae bacterium]|nr:hypothetical protein [Steroidobacteraceae bacterium]
MSERSRTPVGVSCLLTALMGAIATPALAQTRSVSDDQGVMEINDPTSPLRWFQLSDWYNASLHDQAGTINEAVFRTVLPFTIDGNLYAARFTQQDTVSATSGKTGTQDPELIVVRLFTQGWGRWGMGFVLDAPSGAENETSNKWSLGPAIAIATSSDARVQFGANLRTWWSVNGPGYAKNVGIVNLQPVLNIKLGNGQALSLGQSQLEWDTVTNQWKSLQFGVKYDKAFTLADRKWTPYAEADYDFETTKGNPMWTFRAGITVFEPQR